MTSYQTTDAVSSVRASIVRTAVPIIVGGLISLAVSAGVDLDEGVISQVVTMVVTVVYYAIVRLLESKVGPAWGWLLGYARAPEY